MSFDTPQWYAVHTKFREETRVGQNLQAWNVETFAPLIKEARRPDAVNKSNYVVKPLFPRYIFARFDASKLLHKVYYTRGVHSVVSFGKSPIPVAAEAIDLIKSRAEDDGFIRMGDDLKPGDKVSIEAGHLKGFSGIFSRAFKDSERVCILLTAVNYQVSIEIERAYIQKAS